MNWTFDGDVSRRVRQRGIVVTWTAAIGMLSIVALVAMRGSLLWTVAETDPTQFYLGGGAILTILSCAAWFADRRMRNNARTTRVPPRPHARDSRR